MNIQQANKILAKACGVVVYQNYWHLENQSFIEVYGTWTIENAMCREVVREKFRIDTETYGSDMWQCYNHDLDEFYEGKTIAEAEIACMIKSAESLNGY